MFLNAQDRYTTPQGAFLFHAAGAVSTGMVNVQNLRDQANEVVDGTAGFGFPRQARAWVV